MVKRRTENKIFQGNRANFSKTKSQKRYFFWFSGVLLVTLVSFLRLAQREYMLRSKEEFVSVCKHGNLVWMIYYFDATLLVFVHC